MKQASAKIATKVAPKVAPIGLAAFVLVAWEISCRLGWISNLLLPSPSEVIFSLQEHSADLRSAFFETLQGAVLGLSASFVVGTLVGLVISANAWLRSAFMPYLLFFQTVPIIAIAPLFVIWFGFGMATVVASSFVVSVFPIISNTMLGVTSVETNHLELFRVYRASDLQTWIRLKIPSAVPQILGGLRIACGLSVIGAIVGEFIAGGGLGALIDSARTQQKLDLLFAAVILASLVAWLMVTAVGLLEWKLLHRWHPSFLSRSTT